MEIHFRVASSSGADAYDVVAWAKPGELAMTCSCPAGENGLACKHRLELLAGDVGRVVEIVVGRAEDLANFKGDNPITRRLAEIAGLEAEQVALKKRLQQAKKALGRELGG
ncbi:SWIM zinc finger family protein [Phenylobacterium sp.]|uniref:SWIM zinc finger family protein n=1 Tax=Phenylobacterium sp. TaxID=1871053 RepID=UPI0027316374|nr:SWIM zinc finger family protein [Phenylobacterium sp.]MDP2214742.1 SWIM zinc finger family protein [Phenylobacterium sp.]